MAYAASRTVIARTDSGKSTFNASEVVGQLGQAGISLSYYPKQDPDIHGLLTGWAINQGYDIGWNQLKDARLRRVSPSPSAAEKEDSLARP